MTQVSLLDDDLSMLVDDREKFDYTLFAAEIANSARQARDHIRSAHRRAIIDSGKLLLEVKASLGHGHFVSWCEAELGFSATTARNYMRAAEAFSDETATVAVLPPGALYAAAGAPDEVRADVVRRVGAGEILTRNAVKDLINQHRQCARETRAVEVQRAKEISLTEAQKKRRDQRARREAAEDERRIQAMRDAASDVIDRLRTKFTLPEIDDIFSQIREAHHHLDVVLAERRGAHRY